MITASVQGLDEAKSSLIKLNTGLGDLTPLMEWIGRDLSINTAERFHTSKDPEGVAWAELAPSTVKSKKGKKGRGDGKKILIDTGGLLDSITFTSDKSSAFIYSSDNNQEKVNTAQFGKANVPSRAIFGLSEKDQNDIENQSMIWIEGLL